VRVLLDECLPRRLKRDLVGHDARTTPEMGWASKRNGDLLRLAERDFDVFLTVDRKLQHQQNLSTFNIAVVVLVAPSNTLADLQPLMTTVLENLARAKRGEALVLGGGESRLLRNCPLDDFAG
jgi:predicted nuclease of predicted toxin-antitoxin system